MQLYKYHNEIWRLKCQFIAKNVIETLVFFAFTWYSMQWGSHDQFTSKTMARYEDHLPQARLEGDIQISPWDGFDGCASHMKHIYLILTNTWLGGSLRSFEGGNQGRRISFMCLSRARWLSVSVRKWFLHTHMHTHAPHRPAFPVIRQQSRSIIRTSGPK